jgi:hypothetical protein
VTVPASARTPAWPRWLAWSIAALVFAIILTDAVRNPDKHTTMPTYRDASTRWWEGIDPYTLNQHAGFLYFPQAAFLFTPFNALPATAGEIAWRACTFGLFLFALVRLHRVFIAPESNSPRTFLALAVLAIPSAFASLRNAQFDLPLAALVVLTAAEVALRRWNTAALWICLALALKPLAIVPLLLFSTLFPVLIPRMLMGVLLVLALPFLHWNPPFVAREYVRCFQTLAWASTGNEPRYSDLFALLGKAGVVTPEPAKLALRVLFAAVYLALGLAAMRRLKPPRTAWAIGALAADYLMLFNPRTETCSYVMLGPWVASLAVLAAVRQRPRWIVAALSVAALGLACDAFPKLGHFSVHDMTDRWFKPLLALLFLPVLAALIIRRRNI